MKLVERWPIRNIAAMSMMLMIQPVHAQNDPLSPVLVPIGFLVGNWEGEHGHAEGNTQARGTFCIETAAGGAALIRQDHTQLLTATGLPLRTFDQVMLVYPEGGDLHADYFDGTHTIHYQHAQIESGRLVRFVTTPLPGKPVFRLTYKRLEADRLSVSFEMMPPGQSAFRMLAEGTARRKHSVLR